MKKIDKVRSIICAKYTDEPNIQYCDLYRMGKPRYRVIEVEEVTIDGAVQKPKKVHYKVHPQKDEGFFPSFSIEVWKDAPLNCEVNETEGEINCGTEKGRKRPFIPSWIGV